MTHVPEEKLNDAVRASLQVYHDRAEVRGSGFESVRGDRYADMVVENRPRGRQDIAVEVENGVGEYPEAIGQATHYRRAGYVPVIAMPIVPSDLSDPDTDTGETLNVCATADVGLLGVMFEADEAGNPVTGANYVLRPWGY